MQRHDLLDIAPEAWAIAIGGLDLPEEARRSVSDWSRRGRPLIVRRRLHGETDDRVPVALQLPNAVGRLRVALSVSAAALTPRAPVGLIEAARSAPRSWNATISALLDLEAAFGASTVYGGLLWQHVTGEEVLRETSDLDLLWRPPPQRRRALIDALAGLVDSTVRVDGEIVLENGGGVSWRELHAAIEGRVTSVAVKTMEGVTLQSANAILGEIVPW